MRIRPHLVEFERQGYIWMGDIQKEKLLDCAMGKNNFGVSPKVVDLARQYDWSELWNPSHDYEKLKLAICTFWSDYAHLEAENIKIDNGSSRVLERFNRMFIEAGVKVLGYAPQFSGYVNDLKICGGNYDAVPLRLEDNFKFNLDTLASKITGDYSVVYIDNPNNPTGQLISLADIEAILKVASEKGVITLVDEAYGDYVNSANSALNLFNKYKNLVVTRTFTKGYGIGKFRIGYGVFPSELSRYYDKIKLPFSVPTIVSYLAKEALSDQKFIHECSQWVKEEKAKVVAVLKAKGYFVAETCEYCPIFVLGVQDENVDLRQELIGRGILSVSGQSFVNLKKNFVRLNLPSHTQQLLDRF